MGDQPARFVRRRVSLPTDAFAPAPETSTPHVAPGFRRVSARFRAVAASTPLGLPPPYNGYTIPPASTALAPLISCQHCAAALFQFEPKGFCCLSGKVKLAPTQWPTELKSLFSGSDSLSADFRRYIRAYNNAFAFTSLGVKRDSSLMEANAGIYTFRVQGQIYHNLSSLGPLQSTPTPLQMYFVDTDHELTARMNTSSYLLPDVMAILMEIMRVNPYAVFFKALRDLPDLESCVVSLSVAPELDQRVYNTPTVSQVAALWIESPSGGDNFTRSILLRGLDDCIYPIYHNYGCYDSLQYPLLFPHGDVGWHPSIEKIEMVREVIIRDNESLASFLERQRSGTPSYSLISTPLCCIPSLLILCFLPVQNTCTKTWKSVACRRSPKRIRLSCRDYYCYKLQIRPASENLILQSGRLFQQFVVDIYVKIETGRLQYIKQNQQQLRADLYQGLVDSVGMGIASGASIGRRVVLPASFIGGPRDMRRRYLDAMALVRQYGKPDIFLTITCNPSWPEIVDQLAPFELAQNRPDIVSRVFRAKVEALKDRLIDQGFFGQVAAYVYVVEFQKRGLPHAHFLIILQRHQRIRTTAQIDAYVSAELPPPQPHSRLHNLVVKHMLHGPCGALNPRNVCMNKLKQCKNKYPRAFTEATIFGDDSFPVYKRSCNGPTVLVRSAVLDNTWVVPYNPLLLAEFDCHLNVEVCSSIKAVKYLYKYIYKGHDKAQFTLQSIDTPTTIDEVSAFQDARWISPPEAAWRIFAFPLNEMYPHVYTLQVHLPGFHQVHFHDQSNLNTLLSLPGTECTMLTAYFTLNMVDSTARQLLYKQIPESFVWDKSSKIWERRKHKLVIGRLVSVNLTEGERYYLRLLLAHVRGATSFTALRTVGNVVCPTFREACMLLGLLQDDRHHLLCFEEALQYAMPCQLRQLFVIVLAYGAIQDPKSVWEQYKTDMVADFVEQGYQLSTAVDLALQRIQNSLDAIGKDIREFGLVDHNFQPQIPENSSCPNESDYMGNAAEICVSLAAQLNAQQRSIYDMVVHAIDSSNSLCIFVDGPGGTGKTFLYTALLAYVRSKNKVALPVASSGVAAALLPEGRTAHNRFKLPLAVDEHMQCSITKQSAAAALLREAALFIWDEAPMLHRFCFESVDRLLRDITSTDLPFGGKVFVLGGDFRQVLPVLPRANKEDICKATIVSSYLWPQLVKQRLTHNMRALSDPTYSGFLLQVGSGDVCSDPTESLQIPTELLIQSPDEDNALQLLVDAVFPNLANWPAVFHLYKNRVLLTPKNETVDSLNEILINMLPAQPHIYYSFDEALDSTDKTFEIDFLNTLNPPGLPLHELRLKPDCPLILLRNLSAGDGLCNGTRLIAKRFLPNLIQAEITTGDRAGQTVFIPRITFVPPESQEHAFSFKRTQFPVKLCFGMTLNKAQGQTLDFVGLFLKDHVFAHGQLYVGLSRVRDANSIKVLIGSKDDFLLPGHTRNIVYKELFHQTN